MKRKHLSLALAVLLAAGGLWLSWRSDGSAFQNTSTRTSVGSSADVDFKTPDGPSKSGQMHRPPDQTQRFKDFTPEQRVEFARRGHGPGG
jgi:hypothetical protein